MNRAIREIRSRILTDKSSHSIKVLHPFPNFTLYCVYAAELNTAAKAFKENIPTESTDEEQKSNLQIMDCNHHDRMFVIGSSIRDADESWWQFRGPSGEGRVISQDLVQVWSESQNIAENPHDRGWSSPVISGEHICLTTATRDGHRLYAVCIKKEFRKDCLRSTFIRCGITAKNHGRKHLCNTHSGRLPRTRHCSLWTYGTACLKSYR